MSMLHHRPIALYIVISPITTYYYISIETDLAMAMGVYAMCIHSLISLQTTLIRCVRFATDVRCVRVATDVRCVRFATDVRCVRVATDVRCVRFATDVRCVRFATDVRCVRFATDVRCDFP